MEEQKDISILIIEDDAMFRSLAFQVFEGCHKITAENAEGGFEKFKEHCPDITLLDIGLPDKNGLDLLPELIAYDPEAFIVMLTASRVLTDVEKAKKRGAAGYIVKPFTFKKVTDCLNKYTEYKKKLQELTPEQRADNYIKELKTKALDDALKKHQEKEKQAFHEEFKNWNILFADTSETNRERAQIQIQRLGCTVDIAATGEEIIEHAKSNRYDLMFIDAHIPKIDGYETTKLLRQNSKNKCVIIGMVQSTMEVKNQLWKDAGMDSFIEKPATFLQVREMIEKYIILRIKLGSK